MSAYDVRVVNVTLRQPKRRLTTGALIADAR